MISSSEYSRVIKIHIFPNYLYGLKLPKNRNTLGTLSPKSLPVTFILLCYANIYEDETQKARLCVISSYIFPLRWKMKKTGNIFGEIVPNFSLFVWVFKCSNDLMRKKVLL